MTKVDFKKLPLSPYGSPLPIALKEELLAEIAERKRLITLNYTDEQFEAHMQLWKKERQPAGSGDQESVEQKTEDDGKEE